LKGEVEAKDFLNFHLVDTRVHDGSLLAEKNESVAILQYPNRQEKSLGIAAQQTFARHQKCLVNSARRTGSLQQTGMATIDQKVKGGEMEEPTVYGDEHHYIHVGCWTSPGLGILSRLQPSSNSEDTPGEIATPRTLSELLTVKQPTIPNPVLAIPHFEFLKYVYLKRLFDKSLWPSPNTCAISSRKTLAEMLTLGYVMKLLALEGIIPVVSSPNPADKNQTIKVAFGPLLDNNHNPCVPGGRYRASSVYQLSRMKNSVDHHDAWLSNFWSSDTVIPRIAGKSGLPVEVEIIKGMSPIGELLRIDAGLPRIGFPFHGSGGNAVTNGLAPPSATAHKTTSGTAAEGATFESSQSVLNKNNRVMLQICEASRPVKVFLAGDVLPPCLYDKQLQTTIGASTEQAVYMGIYDVKWCAQEEEMTREDIVRIMDFYKPYYPDLNGSELRFHLETPKKFLLVPNNNYSSKEGGYQHIEVDTRDNRKPLLEVPAGKTMNSLLTSFQVEDFVSEKTLFKDWVDGRGFLELVEEPFLDPTSNMTNETTSIVHLHEFETMLTPLNLAIGETRLCDKMARRRRRTQTFANHFAILIKCSLGVFARMREMNVDTQNKIGPLIDYDDEYHKHPPTISNYIQIFGCSPCSGYFSHLGRAVQVSPTTHPIRTYDPKVLLLMSCNKGPSARLSRVGIDWVIRDFTAAADLFFQCILIEVVKVEVLLEWSLCYFGDKARRLPTISDIPGFLDFISATIDKVGVRSTNWITQDQYQINENFKDRRMFFQFFSYLRMHLLAWFSKLIQTDFSTDNDVFGAVNKRLTKFINNEGAIGGSCKYQLFHCQHMLLDFNDVVAEFPFGEPMFPHVGFGGCFGAQMLQGSEFKANNQEMVKKVMSGLLCRYGQQPDLDLAMLGLKKFDGCSVPAVSINGRPLGLCDPEHCCCMQYPILERAIGGSKGISNRPKLTSSFCFPIYGCKFEAALEVATKALTIFRDLVDTDKWIYIGDTAKEDGKEKGRSSGKTTVGNTENRVDNYVRRKQSGQKRTRSSTSPYSHQNCDITTVFDETAKNRECNLMLGMIYGNIKGDIHEIGGAKNCSPQLRRDTARCLCTENCCGRDTYTLDNRDLGCRVDRHINQSICKLNLDHPLMKVLVGRVRQVCLDHFWYMDGYWVERVFVKDFFTKSLPIFCDLLCSLGSIYIGLSAGVFIQVVDHEDIFKKQFRLSLLHKDNVHEIDLVKGSHIIPDNLYKDEKCFGGKDQDPERAFGFTSPALLQKEVAGTNSKHIIKRFQQLVDGAVEADFRFLKLTKIC
jgi:hypothetical protein